MTDSQFRASTEARRAICRLAQDATGTMTGLLTDPDPLLAIPAALSLQHAVAAEVRAYVKAARQHGYSWGRIGELMALETDPVTGRTAGEAAFLRVASDFGSGPVFPWTCPSCREVVKDRGPEAGHPADAEPGHAPNCERLAEAEREYDAQWAEEEDAEAWGGRGPSASYEEWAAEGQAENPDDGGLARE